MEERVPVSGDIYRHFKNKLYQIVGVATHSETREKYVVYQGLYDGFEMYIRPYDMFMSEVDHVKYPDVKQKYRFERVDRAELLKAAPGVNAALKNASSEAKNIPQIQAEPEAVSEPVDGEVNPYLMEFFDRESSKDKIEYLCSIRNRVDDRMINDIAVSLDLTVDEADVDTRFDSLINCLKMKARFETGRLR